MNLASSKTGALPLPEQAHRLLASFGRRRGRKLRPNRQGLVDSLLPEISVKIPHGGMLDPAALFPQKKTFFLEIGFGGGEHLAHQAALRPDTGIIGCEPYINGTATLLARIHEHKLNNIRIHNEDARPLIAKLPDASLSRVFILYPDPWPKARHHKRRLVSTEFLDALARVMKPGAELRLATDDEDYCTWILEHLLTHRGYIWNAKTSDDWLNPPADWISTRYEQKALKAGRVPTYLRFTRR
jgi:tRNA (guanine-N7-)-methyltransferase